MEKLEISIYEAFELCRKINEEGAPQSYALCVSIKGGY